MRSLVGLLALAAIGAALLTVPAPGARAAAGDLDRSFSHDGRRITDLFGRSDRAYAVAVQGRGILVGGLTRRREYGAGIVRYCADGRIGRRFAHHGRFITNRMEELDALAVTPSGKIVLAGFFDGDLAVARLLPDGHFDRGFGGDGMARVDRGGIARPHDVTIDRRGRIVVVGSIEDISAGKDYFLAARFHHDGSLDRSFGDHGVVKTHFGTGTYVLGYGVAIQDDGKIVASATIGNNWAVIRFRRNGTLDPSFGNADGIEYTSPLLIGDPFDVAIQPNGKIVTGGGDYRGGLARFGLGRYLTDGRPDPSFGDGGAVRTLIGKREAGGGAAFSLALALHGRIVLAGGAAELNPDHPGASPLRFALARYRHDGRLDRSFAGDGKRMVDMRPGVRRHDDSGRAVTIDGKGRIVIAGYSTVHPTSSTSTDPDFATARLLGR